MKMARTPGGEENYAYLEAEKVHAVVKYNTYHKERSKAWKSNIGKVDNSVRRMTEPESVFG